MLESLFLIRFSSSTKILSPKQKNKVDYNNIWRTKITKKLQNQLRLKDKKEWKERKQSHIFLKSCTKEMVNDETFVQTIKDSFKLSTKNSEISQKPGGEKSNGGLN